MQQFQDSLSDAQVKANIEALAASEGMCSDWAACSQKYRPDMLLCYTGSTEQQLEGYAKLVECLHLLHNRPKDLQGLTQLPASILSRTCSCCTALLISKGLLTFLDLCLDQAW